MASYNITTITILLPLTRLLSHYIPRGTGDGKLALSGLYFQSNYDQILSVIYNAEGGVKGRGLGEGLGGSPSRFRSTDLNPIRFWSMASTSGGVYQFVFFDRIPLM